MGDHWAARNFLLDSKQSFNNFEPNFSILQKVVFRFSTMVENRKKERKYRKPEYVAPVKSKYKEKKSEPPKKERFLPEKTVQIIGYDS